MRVMNRKYVNYKKVQHLICDWDGTIASFHNWFSPAMRDIVDYLSRRLYVSKEEVGVALAVNMRWANSHECSFPFLGPWFKSQWHGTNAEFVREITGPYFEMLDSTRERFLTGHPGSLEALEEAARLGVGLSLLSDAPLYATMAKAVHLKVNHLLCGVYALEVREPDASLVWNQADHDFCLARTKRYLSLADKFNRAVPVPYHMEKPNTGGAQMILRDCGAEADRTVIIGDNLLKDGGVGKAMGFRFVWARYGATDYAAPEYRYVLETLLHDHQEKPFTWVQPPAELPPVDIEAPTFGAVIPLLSRWRKPA